MMPHFGANDAKIMLRSSYNTKIYYMFEGEEIFKVKLLFTEYQSSAVPKLDK